MSWSHPALHPTVVSALQALYQKPFPIQTQLFSNYLHHQVLIASSQTGSGKTVAFSAPIVSQHIYQGDFEHSVKRSIVISPTRELALQTYENIKSLLPQQLRRKVCSLIGGMSEEKQKRLLQPAVMIIGTPGRIVQMVDDNELDLSQISIVVIDEADRMVQLGAFRQLDFILQKIYLIPESKNFLKRIAKDQPSNDQLCTSVIHTIPYEKFITQRSEGFLEDQNMIGQDDNQEQHQIEGRNWEGQALQQKCGPLKKRIKIIFISATLTKQYKNTKYYNKNFKNKKKHNSQGKEELIPKLQAILSRIGSDKKSKIIDLSEGLVPSGLFQMKSFCQNQEKLLYLYMFLEEKLYQSKKTIVFCNKIGACRSLGSLLTLLGIQNVVLHSQMQQRQRLDKVQLFIKKVPVLVTTDLAARGIDVPVDIVVQYNLPRDCDTYIHRVGRTARALRAGISLIIVSRQDAKVWRQFNEQLKRQAAIFQVSQSKYASGLEMIQKAISIQSHHRELQKHVNKHKFDKLIDQKLDLLDSESDNQNQEERQLRLQRIRKNSQKLRLQLQGAKAKNREVGFKGGQILRKGRVFLSPEEASRIAKNLAK